MEIQGLSAACRDGVRSPGGNSESRRKLSKKAILRGGFFAQSPEPSAFKNYLYFCAQLSIMGRILAFDYGKKRTGIAVTDPMQIIASPLTTVSSAGIESF